MRNVLTKKHNLKIVSLAFALLFIGNVNADAQGRKSLQRLVRTAPAAFYTTAEAQRVAEQVLLYQRVTGGWPKNIDMVKPLGEAEKNAIAQQKHVTDDSTVDNNATTTQMNYLALMYKATGNKTYKEAVQKGIKFLLSGQYANGGWPQFWPNPQGYQVHITYNDGNMQNIMQMFGDILNAKAPYDSDIVSKKTKKRIQKAYDKGIECIVNTQIRVDGKPTVWCQQHDRTTYAPAPARAYELPSFCSAESMGLVRVLMDVENPDAKVKAAIHGAMAWFDKNKIMGKRIERTESDVRLVDDENATPIWARFYDLEMCKPFVCDRDGVMRRELSEIGIERRMGYAWYTPYVSELYTLYAEWAKKHDSDNMLNIKLY